MPTTTGYINLSVNGNEAREQECERSFDYFPATGDGRHEPSYGAYVVLYSVKSKGVELISLLDADCIKKLESELLRDHEEAMQPDPDYLRDMREELA